MLAMRQLEEECGVLEAQVEILTKQLEEGGPGSGRKSSGENAFTGIQKKYGLDADSIKKAQAWKKEKNSSESDGLKLIAKSAAKSILGQAKENQKEKIKQLRAEFTRKAKEMRNKAKEESIEAQIEELKEYISYLNSELAEGGPGSGRRPGGGSSGKSSGGSKHGYGWDTGYTPYERNPVGIEKPKYGYHNQERSLPNMVARLSSSHGEKVNDIDSLVNLDMKSLKRDISQGGFAAEDKGRGHGEHEARKKYSNDLKNLVRTYEQDGNKADFVSSLERLSKEYTSTKSPQSKGTSAMADYKNAKNSTYDQSLAQHGKEIGLLLKNFK